MAEICLKPIGMVKNDFSKETSKWQWQEAVSEIIIFSEFQEDLMGIELFKYIVVIFWMHKASSRKPKGSLASCKPCRPNPIGLTFVELLGRQGNILKVKGLDAFDGTPVIDIKPYKPWSSKRLKEKIPDINLKKPGERSQQYPKSLK